MRRFTRFILVLLFALTTAAHVAAQDQPGNSTGGAESAPAPAMNLNLVPPDGAAVQPKQNPMPGGVQGNAAAYAVNGVSMPESSLLSMPTADYAANAKSDVFGANLFVGSFARGGATQFNPDYVISAGDRIQVRLWGGFNFDGILLVDPQGNVFLPQVGPVRIAGVRNANQIGRASCRERVL